MLPETTIAPVTIGNQQLEICLENNGGVIGSVTHISSDVNPLSFRMARAAGSGQFFTGHFICAPRWGDAGGDEMAKGAIKHGEFCHLPWEISYHTDHAIHASALSEIDDIKIEREITLSPDSPVCSVVEKITNTGRQFRPCNLVQHPTIAAPFLNENTRIDCSATYGWRDMGPGVEPISTGEWPESLNQQNNCIILNHSNPDNAGVYSFRVKNNDTAWMTAYDPTSGLLLGYCWNANEYPWVHHWIHVENNKAIYRGLEFGTAALHQPFEVIAANNWWQWYDAPSCFFLIAGGSRIFSYQFFLVAADKGLYEVTDVAIANERLKITGNAGDWSMTL